MKKEILREDWRDIEGYEGIYQVSNLGRVKSFKYKKRLIDGKILKLNSDGNGYLIVFLSKKSVVKCVRVNILVLSAFVGPRPFKYDACHSNDEKTDNWLDNLYWGTRSQNLKDRTRNGKYIIVTGENHHTAKYSDAVVSEIRRKRSLGESVPDLSEEFSISKTYVYYILRNEARVSAS